MPAASLEPNLFTNYSTAQGVYDEAFDNASPRRHWEQFVRQLNQLGDQEFDKRVQQADEWLGENGVTYGVVDNQDVRNRPWQLDLIPYIIDEQTWETIEQGIQQRARLYDLIIKDLYGPKSVLSEGILPAEALFAHTRFLRPAHDLHALETPSLIIYGIELARSPDGKFWVMADRSDAPAGSGFALENRIISRRTIPQLCQSVQIRQLAPYFHRLKKTLKRLAPHNQEHPRVAILTSGPGDPHYFEDVYLARYLGYDLARGSDLAVRDNSVYLKTLAGLLQVDVILARGTEAGIDPVELGGGAPHGVPGLLSVIRAGNVAIANRPGSGLIESPIFMALLPALAQHFLQEPLQLPSIATWWCQLEQDRDYVLNNLSKLVIKPAFTASGGKELYGGMMTKDQLADLKAKILQTPYAWIAQESIARSTVPCFTKASQNQPNGVVRSGHCAIRTFAVADKESYSVMPGGLVRVSSSAGPMELSVSGGETSKDLWVVTSQTRKEISLLPEEHKNVALKRTSAMFPSRVADDLFWLGQSIERADMLARCLRSLTYRLNTESGEIDQDTIVLCRSMAGLEIIPPQFGDSTDFDNYSQLREALPRLSVDVERINGFAGTVQEMLRLAGLVRDWISAEAWQQLHRAGNQYLLQGLTESDNRSDSSFLIDALDDLLMSLASAMGLIDNGMIRSPAWRFLDLGRRIERARTTTLFLTGVLESNSYQDTVTLRMILEVFDCQMTYRSRYLDDLQANAVLDLCVTDSTNPRSVDSQITLIAEHVDSLPDNQPNPLRNEEKRIAMAIIHAIKMLTSDDLGATPPKPLLAALKLTESKLKSMRALLERKYLLHSGELRQIGVPAEAVS